MDYSKVKTNIKEAEKVTDSEATEEQRPKLESVVTGKVVKRKKGVMERLVIGLLGPNGVRSIGRKLNEDIVVPAIKNIVVDSITSGIQMAIFGRDNGTPVNNRPSQNNYYRGHAPTNYQSSYQAPQSRYQQPVSGGFVSSTRVPEFILADRRDADNILRGLREMVISYGSTSLADYYDLVGQDSSYTDNQYGWYALDSARIIPQRGGYLIQFPPLELLDI